MSVTAMRIKRITFLLFLILAIHSCGFLVKAVLGIKQPKFYDTRQISHEILLKRIHDQEEGAFKLLYRKLDFAEHTGLEEYYDLSLRLYNRHGQAADLNKTAEICEKTQWGYKHFKNGEIRLDQLIWEEDVTALGQFLLNLEKVKGESILIDDLPFSRYYFINYYSSYVVGPQRRKSRLLKNALDYEKDSIFTIYINADFNLSDTAYLHQYKNTSNEKG